MKHISETYQVRLGNPLNLAAILKTSRDISELQAVYLEAQTTYNHAPSIVLVRETVTVIEQSV